MRPNVKRLILGSILTVVMGSSVGCVYPDYYDRYDRSYYYRRYDRDYSRRYDPDYRYSRSRYWNRWSSDRDWVRSHRWEHDQGG